MLEVLFFAVETASLNSMADSAASISSAQHPAQDSNRNDDEFSWLYEIQRGIRERDRRQVEPFRALIAQSTR